MVERVNWRGVSKSRGLGEKEGATGYRKIQKAGLGSGEITRGGLTGEKISENEDLHGTGEGLKLVEVPGVGKLSNKVSVDISEVRDEGIAGSMGGGEVRDFTTWGEQKGEGNKGERVLPIALGECVGVSVLREIDQNVNSSVEIGGKGTWKRRARQAGKTGGKETAEGEAMDVDNSNGYGKREFRLRDEDLPGKENSQVGKKIKCGSLEENNYNLMVGDASQKWHHPDQ